MITSNFTVNIACACVCFWNFTITHKYVHNLMALEQRCMLTMLIAIGGNFVSLHRNVPTDFSWEFPNGFEVSPTSGSLAPKQKCKLTAVFQPQAADVYSAVAVCSYGEEEHHSTKPMRLKGIGKYPHVTVQRVSGKAMAKRSPPVTRTAAASDTGAQVEGEGGGSTPHEVLLDFGAVAVGDIRDRWIEVTNVSPVSVTTL